MGIGEFSLGVLGNLVATAIDKGLSVAFRNRLYMPLFMHKRELRQTLNGMPFIYKDLALDLVTDFVSAEISTINKETLKPRSLTKVSRIKASERLREFKKALLFGDGGFGKTTFFRVAILSILGEKTQEKFLPDSERLVPIFVPLKTIRNTSASPIIDTILSSNTYFSGAGGYRRLLRLSQDRRVVLFLDGYDETPYAGGFDTVVSELEMIFGSDYERRQAQSSSPNIELYANLSQCRVYLSSRREFFLTNAFKVTSEIPAWLMEGIGDRRGLLVENIFRKYKDSDAWLAESLSYEYFMQQLAKCADESLKSLANSPLFLTVMCYVYVTDLRDGKPVGAVFKSGASALAIQCVRLLIEDVDAYKARGLGSIERKALLGRRNAYPDEKFAFLKFVASESYRRDSAVFSKSKLQALAFEFFDSASESNDAGEIRSNVYSDDASVNIVMQLIYSGVFVVVEKSANDLVVDFPHRRFREALAIENFNTESGLQYLSENVDQSNLSELILFIVDQTGHSHRLIRAIAEKVIALPGRIEIARLLLQCMRRLDDDEFNSNLCLRVLSKISASKGPVLPRDLVDVLPRDLSFRELSSQSLISAIERCIVVDVARWTVPVLDLDRKNFVGCVKSALANACVDLETCSVLLATCSANCQELVDDLLFAITHLELSGVSRNDVLSQIFYFAYLGQDHTYQLDFQRRLSSSYKQVDANFSRILLTNIFHDLLVIFASKADLVLYSDSEKIYKRQNPMPLPRFWD